MRQLLHWNERDAVDYDGRSMTLRDLVNYCNGMENCFKNQNRRIAQFQKEHQQMLNANERLSQVNDDLTLRIMRLERHEEEFNLRQLDDVQLAHQKQIKQLERWVDDNSIQETGQEMNGSDKERMRELVDKIIRGEKFTAEEKLEYEKLKAILLQ